MTRSVAVRFPTVPTLELASDQNQNTSHIKKSSDTHQCSTWSTMRMRMSLLHSLLLLTIWLPHSSTAFANNKPWGVLGRSSTARSASTSTTTSVVSAVSDENLALLSARGRKVIQALQDFPGQAHVLADWPAPGTEDEGKRRLAEQVRSMLLLLLFVPMVVMDAARRVKSSHLSYSIIMHACFHPCLALDIMIS